MMDERTEKRPMLILARGAVPGNPPTFLISAHWADVIILGSYVEFVHEFAEDEDYWRKIWIPHRVRKIPENAEVREVLVKEAVDW